MIGSLRPPLWTNSYEKSEKHKKDTQNNTWLLPVCSSITHRELFFFLKFGDSAENHTWQHVAHLKPPCRLGAVYFLRADQQLSRILIGFSISQQWVCVTLLPINTLWLDGDFCHDDLLVSCREAGSSDEQSGQLAYLFPPCAGPDQSWTSDCWPSPPGQTSSVRQSLRLRCRRHGNVAGYRPAGEGG